MEEDTNDSNADQQSEDHAPNAPESDSVSLFLAGLTEHFDRDEVVRNVKRTEKGVFVTKEFAEKLPAAYKDFLYKLTSGTSSKSIEKCKKRLFGVDTPSSFYLFEGKQSIIGWLIDVDVNTLASSILPLYRGAPVDARGYLHHKDPIFEEIEHISTETDRSGFRIFVERPSGKIELNTEILSSFSELVSQSKNLTRYYPQAHLSARQALGALAKALRKAKSVNPKKESLYVPLAYLKKKGLRHLRVGSLHFLCDASWMLLRILDTKGPNLRSLLIEDYDFLVSQSKGRGSSGMNTKYFRLNKRKGAMLGEVLTETRRYPLNVHALSDFASRLREVRPRIEFSKPLYSVSLLLEELSSRYQKAERVSSGSQGRAKGKNVNEQRKAGNLIFELDAKSNIRNISVANEGAFATKAHPRKKPSGSSHFNKRGSGRGQGKRNKKGKSQGRQQRPSGGRAGDT